MSLFCTTMYKLFIKPRRIHSGQKDKEKEGYGWLYVVISDEQPFPSPHSPHLARHFTRLRLCFSGLVGQGRAPPPHPYPMVNSEAGETEIEDGLYLVVLKYDS